MYSAEIVKLIDTAVVVPIFLLFILEFLRKNTEGFCQEVCNTEQQNCSPVYVCASRFMKQHPEFDFSQAKIS